MLALVLVRPRNRSNIPLIQASSSAVELNHCEGAARATAAARHTYSLFSGARAVQT